MNNKGFTLVEITVTVTIMILLSGVVLVDYRAGAKQFALERSAHKLAQDIRKAQGMAMSARECQECPSPTIVPQRYGVYINPPNSDFYKIFADINDDGILNYPNPTPDVLIMEAMGGKDSINYEKNITLSNISWVGCDPKGPKRVHITFAPSDPTTELWIGVSGNPNPPVKCSEIILTLRAGTSGPTQSVRLNNAGLIYVSQ